MVLGLLQSRTYGFVKSRENFTIGNTVVIPKGSISPVWLFVAIGALFLLWFFLHIHSSEKKGRDVLLPLRLFRNKIANLGMGTQTIQWLILQGSFFTVSVLRTTLPPQLRLNDARPVLFVVLLGLIVALILSDPGRIDRQATWLRVLTALPIGLITIPNGGATLRLVAAILFGEPFTQSARACSRPVRSSG